MNRPVITIEAHEIPSGQFTLGIVEPLFEDRRLASKRMPSVNSNEKVGYTSTQLTLSMCIREVNSKPIPFNPADPVAVLKQLPTDDTQFLVATFVSAFTLNELLAEDAMELATKLKDENGLTYVIPKDKLPNKTANITFRRPRTSDEISVQRRFPGDENNPGYTTSELLFAECIEALDDKTVEKPKDMITLFDSWPLLDQQYAQAVFSNIAYMKAEDFEKVEDLGKSLLDRLKSLKASTSKVSKKGTASTTTSN